jgi:hypothetical protein
MTAFIQILLFEGGVQLSILRAGVNLDRRPYGVETCVEHAIWGTDGSAGPKN